MYVSKHMVVKYRREVAKAEKGKASRLFGSLAEGRAELAELERQYLACHKNAK